MLAGQAARRRGSELAAFCKQPWALRRVEDRVIYCMQPLRSSLPIPTLISSVLLHLQSKKVFSSATESELTPLSSEDEVRIRCTACFRTLNQFLLQDFPHSIAELMTPRKTRLSSVRFDFFYTIQSHYHLINCKSAQTEEGIGRRST